MFIKLVRPLVAALTFGILGQPMALADSLIPPMTDPIPGTWEDVSLLGSDLPIPFDAIWFEPESFSLIHVQTSDAMGSLSHDGVVAALENMADSTSFWGEPPHANAAQFFANEVYLQPTSYNVLIGQAIDEVRATGKLSGTPGIWVLPEATGNPHLFYHGQLTPRIALAIVDDTLQIGEAYVPHKKTRGDFIRTGLAEAIVLEVQTTDPAIAEAVDRTGLPEWLKTERFRYCVVLHAAEGFANPRREHIWLATPLGAGIDCDAILEAFGMEPA